MNPGTQVLRGQQPAGASRYIGDRVPVVCNAIGGRKQMAISDLFAIAFWPVTAGASLVLWIADHRLVTVRAIAAAVIAAFSLAGTIALVAFDIASRWVLLDFLIGTTAFGGGCLVYVYTQWPKSSVWTRTWMGAFGAAMLTYGAWCLIADHFLPPLTVEGAVQKLDTSLGLGPEEGLVSIDGGEYKATGRLFRTLQVGERVRVEVGQGSRYIYRINGEPSP
jgi:hypothetical protein